MIDTDKYEGHTHTKEWGDIVYADGYLPIFLNDGVYATDLDRELMTDAPLILAAYDKQVRWINDILFRLEKMEEASASQRLRFLLTVQEELEMMIE
jgi:hypothetical protein